MKRNVGYDSLREWLGEIERIGELRTVRGANWQQEIGLLTDDLQHDEKAPAVLFDDIPGYPSGYRVLVNAFGGRRENIMLGFPATLTKVELSNVFLGEYRDAKTRRVPFQTVSDGPILENVLLDNAIDLLKFPAPMWHAEDGGRYIGTGCFSVTADPENGWINVGTYRVMVHDSRRVGFYISPGKHGRIHRDKYTARGESMPVCIVIGADPLTFLMASQSIPSGICEFDIAGAYRERPLRVVKGRFTDLPFPADAEIVLEGFCHPGEELPEGPFGEWTGFYGSPGDKAPVLDIKAIYHRSEPIITGCPPQRPPGESSRRNAIMRSALLREDLQKAGVPDVTGVWAHEVGGARMLIGVAINQRYPGHARQAGHIAAQCGAGVYCGKYVIVVDDDVDVSDLDDLISAMVFRSDPAQSIDFIKGGWSSPLDPVIPPEEKAKGNYTTSRAVIDACRPFHWRDRYPKTSIADPALVRQVRQKFAVQLAGAPT